MRIHSDAAWQIASYYSYILASGTRDLAASIDVERDKIKQSIIEVILAQRNPRPPLNEKSQLDSWDNNVRYKEILHIDTANNIVDKIVAAVRAMD